MYERAKQGTLKIVSLAVALTVANWASALDPAFAAGAEKTEGSSDDLIDCLVIDQKDQKVGKIKIYLARDRARIDAMNGSTTMLTSAPKWDVFTYNRDNQCFRVSQADWYKRGLDRLVKPRRAIFDSRKNLVQHVTFMGRPALKASRTAMSGKGKFDAFFQGRDKDQKGDLPTRVTYIASSALGLSKGISKFMEGFYLTPPHASVLLDCTATQDGRTYEKWMATRSIVKKKVPKSMFVEPKGKKPVSSITAVITGKGIEEMMLNFSGAK